MESAEEKQFVLYDGSANDPAELVALQSVPFCCKRIPRVEDSIPYKFEKAAVKLVRTRFRYDIDRAGGVISILSGDRAGFDFELLHCVGKWQW